MPTSLKSILALAGIALPLLSFAEEPKSISPVMDGTKSIDSQIIARKELTFEQFSSPQYRFLVQNVRWSDGTEARTLAAVSLNTELPVEFIVIDNFAPQPYRKSENDPPLAIDETGKLGNFHFRITSTVLDVNELLINPERVAHVPKCHDGEKRAIARFTQPVTATEPMIKSESAAQDIDPDGRQKIHLTRGRLVCLSLD